MNVIRKANTNTNLFIFSDEMFIPFWFVWNCARFAVLSHVRLLPLLGVLDDLVLLLRIQHMFRHVTMSDDFADLWMVAILVFQLVRVRQGHLLPLLQDTQLLRGFGLPQPDVHFIRARQNVLVVPRPHDRRQPLHPLRVIHLPGVTLVRPVQPDCGVSK